MFSKLGQRKSLTEQVEEELTAAIRAGKYLPGQKIPTESELCQIFNVSRTAVREAVKKMSARGIIKVRKGSGAYVSEVSVQNASEILNMFFELSSNEDLVLHTIDARQIIEPMLAARAAKSRTEHHIDLLRKNMKNMRSCALDDKKREAELDNDFHNTLLSITGNEVLELLLGPIFSLMPKFKTSVFAKPTSGNLLEAKNSMLEHHQNILEAIERKDAVTASEAMKNHLLETRANYVRSIN
ncbi:FadR/GntR family transcriptional regulator [Kriegella aquimaris]|uniref:Transcriptional regulator, GntR family n=1 Tax=Kriegella aquimaris TaxID=192904 RepID=A0A1G9WU18_9FLAO|nr:FadR/GntR family transcriptional regulator [Kriegella aquimaris]SDM87887.1 transcriptional regulator, GntR family [Kriegella aquimaris]